MKFLKIISISLALCFPSISLPDDFRDSSWGDSVETVKQQEESELLANEGDTLFYKGSIAGLDMLVTCNN